MGALCSPQPCDAGLSRVAAHPDGACRFCLNGVSPLDRVEGWLIERRLDDNQDPICRASVPGPGTWFSARVHLDADDVIVVPAGLHRPGETGLEAVRDALRRCRASVLYL